VQLLDFDEKRMHYFQRMYHTDEGHLAATCEHLSIFIDMRVRRSAQMPPQVQAALHDIFETHRAAARPEQTLQPMGIRRR
jgi:acyl-CoA thioesterase FadM